VTLFPRLCLLAAVAVKALCVCSTLKSLHYRSYLIRVNFTQIETIVRDPINKNLLALCSLRFLSSPTHLAPRSQSHVQAEGTLGGDIPRIVFLVLVRALKKKNGAALERGVMSTNKLYPSILIMESSDPWTPLTRITHESPAWGLLRWIQTQVFNSVRWGRG